MFELRKGNEGAVEISIINNTFPPIFSVTRKSQIKKSVHKIGAKIEPKPPVSVIKIVKNGESRW